MRCTWPEPLFDSTSSQTVAAMKPGFVVALYVDADQRPLGFAMRRTVGMREGLEALPELQPPVFE